MSAIDNVSPAMRRWSYGKIWVTAKAWPFTLKFGILIVTLVAFAGVFAPWLTPYNPIKGDFKHTLAAPSWQTRLPGCWKKTISRRSWTLREDLTTGCLSR